MNKLTPLLIKKPYLAWYVKDPTTVSVESIVEHIFNYGQWSDYLQAEQLLGMHRIKAVFESLKGKTRSNLHPKTINFFDRYFAKYA